MNQYKIFALRLDDEELPVITNDFKISNICKSDNFVREFQQAINLLNDRDREIIIKAYLSQDELLDYEVYDQMGLVPSTYYRYKKRAIRNLSFALRRMMKCMNRLDVFKWLKANNGNATMDQLMQEFKELDAIEIAEGLSMYIDSQTTGR